MKKIVIAFDGTNYSSGAMAFAVGLNKLSPILLAGSFLPQIYLSSSWSYAVGGAGLYNPLLEDFNAEAIAEHVRRFEKTCNSEGIEWRVHQYPYDLAIPEIRKETRFADLLLVGGETFYRHYGMERPNEYLRMALQEAECPVMVVPEEFPFPDRTVLAYDGSEDSVYAIRQFALLFPELSKMPATLVHAASKDHSGLPEKDYILELVSRHYPDLTVKTLESTTKKQLGESLKGHPSSLLVCGAFGRTDISMMFRRSFAAGAIIDHQFPIFIAHRS
ncbi:universal stress protein [Chitinophaga pollutisoli]|uniref:Universal stress protein n=1 Tax=Chitinophaga pollutisoli TaxID=3133966 RepID=A0ABZ2YM21_9BACT